MSVYLSSARAFWDSDGELRVVESRVRKEYRGVGVWIEGIVGGKLSGVSLTFASSLVGKPLFRMDEFSFEDRHLEDECRN